MTARIQWPPSSTLVVLLYGTTYAGGTYGKGTVFSITTGGAENLLYNFGYGTDGSNPSAGLLEMNGTLFGTTFAGSLRLGNGLQHEYKRGGTGLAQLRRRLRRGVARSGLDRRDRHALWHDLPRLCDNGALKSAARERMYYSWHERLRNRLRVDSLGLTPTNDSDSTSKASVQRPCRTPHRRSGAALAAT